MNQRNVIPDKSPAFNEKDTFSSFEELATQARYSEIPLLYSTSLFIFENKQKIIFQFQAFLEDTGISLCINWHFINRSVVEWIERLLLKR